MIPKLVEMATEQVELASVPFTTFVANRNQKGDFANYSFVLRGYVRHWLGNVWAEYERTGLVDIVHAKEAAKPAGRARSIEKMAEAGLRTQSRPQRTLIEGDSRQRNHDQPSDLCDSTTNNRRVYGRYDQPAHLPSSSHGG